MESIYPQLTTRHLHGGFIDRIMADDRRLRTDLELIAIDWYWTAQ